jgi:hypothetical protein
MVELSGSLGSKELLAIIEFLSDLRQTGSLQLLREGWSARLDFRDGRLIAATFADEHGLGPVMSIGQLMDKADFVYTGEAIPELSSVPAGPLAQSMDDTQTAVAACPKLGFADDPASHFRRPTAVHRCFASGSVQPVSTLEQREFCLSGEHPACPRFQAAGGGVPREKSATRSKTADADQELVQGHSALEQPVPGNGLRDTQLLSARASVAALEPPETTESHAANGLIDRFLPPVSIPADGLIDRLLPPVSIALAILALIAAFVVFIRPQLEGSRTTSAPAALSAPTLASQPAAAPTLVTAPTLAAASTPAPAQTLVSASRPTAVPALAGALPIATVPPVPTPTTDLAAARTVGRGGVLLDAQFSSPEPGWTSNPPFAMWVAGAYRLSARAPGRFVAASAPLADPVGDVFISATFNKIGGPRGGGYGFILRDQEPARRDGLNQSGQFYVVEVSDRGEFGMWRRDDDHWVDLVNWTFSESVHPDGETNELVVWAVEDRFTLLVNGVEVMTHTDSYLLNGGIGIFVGGDFNEVAIHQFSVSGLPQAAR